MGRITDLGIILLSLILAIASLGDIAGKFISRNRSWNRSKLPVYVRYNPSDAPSGCPSSEIIGQRVQTAANLWSNSLSFFTVTNATPFATTAGFEYDEVNVILWGDNGGDRYYAGTFLNPEYASGEGITVGADIQVDFSDDPAWVWHFGSSPPTTRNNSEIDFVETIAHEIGHMACLADANWSYSIMKSSYEARTTPLRMIDDGSKTGWVYVHTQDALSLLGVIPHTLDIGYLAGRTVNLSGNVTIPAGRVFKLEYGKVTINLQGYSIRVDGGTMEDAGGNVWNPQDIAVKANNALTGHFSTIPQAISAAQQGLGTQIIVNGGVHLLNSDLVVPAGMGL
jgi:hypothetical protein